MNWLARLKNRTGTETDATKTTESLFVVSVAHSPVPFENSCPVSFPLQVNNENSETIAVATPRMDFVVDRGLIGDDVETLWGALKFFCFDNVQADIDAGYSASILFRVNNMAWEYMQADGMGFDEAIRMAANIVAGTQIAVCEAGYVDVMTLFTTMRKERSRDNRAES